VLCRSWSSGRGSQINIPDRHSDLADDLSDDAEDRFPIDRQRRAAAEGSGHHDRGELAGEAVLDGVLRMALLPASVPDSHRAELAGQYIAGVIILAAAPLHGHGVRLVASRGAAIRRTHSFRSR